MNDIKAASNRSWLIWAYFAITFGFSWLFWIPIAITRLEAPLPIIVIGAFSPSLAGTWLTYRSADKAGRHDVWQRVIRLDLIGLRWYTLILLLFPAIMTITFLIESTMGGTLPSLESAKQTLSQPIQLFIFIISMAIGGPLAEELGWRGFALDRLQSKWNALQASLILGLIHAAWHLPLFFMSGTSQGVMGFATALFWLWVIQVVAGSIFFTWVYNNNNRSILSAILVHFMNNATFTVIAQLGNALPWRTELIRTVITVSFAVIVVTVWGSITMVMKDTTSSLVKT